MRRRNAKSELYDAITIHATKHWCCPKCEVNKQLSMTIYSDISRFSMLSRQVVILKIKSQWHPETRWCDLEL